LALKTKARRVPPGPPDDLLPPQAVMVMTAAVRTMIDRSRMRATFFMVILPLFRVWDAAFFRI
jgi:hypothetical protein